MSEKAAKPAKAKKAKRSKAGKSTAKPVADPGVLGNLPASRPQRIGGRRRASAAAEPAASAELRTEDAPAAPPKRVKRAKATAAKPATDGAKATRSGKGAKPAKRRAPAAARAETPKRRPTAGAEAPAPAKRPRPVRAGTPSLADPIADARERAGRESPEAERRAVGPPTGPELVTTAFQAAGELAQIGVSVWTQTLKRAIERLPKP